MNDKIKLKKENNTIKEIIVVDENGEERKYAPDDINFALLEHEDVIEALEDTKVKLSKIVEYSEQRLDEEKKVNKKFKFMMLCAYIGAVILFVVRDPLFPHDLEMADAMIDISLGFLVVGFMHTFGRILLNQYHKNISHDYSYSKANLEQVTKDLEKEKEKTIEESKDEIEFQLENERLDELDRKYERTFGSFYTYIDDKYEYIMELEEEKPKTLGSKKK